MSSIFQSLDSTNKRIIVVAFSITIVLLGASVFWATISQSFAQSGNVTASKPLIGLGCDESSVYYFDSNYNLKRKSKSSAKWEVEK